MEKNSRTYDRFHEITDSYALKYGTQHKTDNLEQKLFTIQKKMQEAMRKNTNQLNMIQKNAQQLYIRAEQGNKKYDEQAQRQLSRLKNISDSTMSELQIAIMERKERQNTIIHSFEEKTQFLRKQIEKQRKIRQQFFISISSTLQDDIPAIMDEVIIGKTNLQKEQERIQQNFDEIIQHSQETLHQFFTDQQQNQQKAVDLITNLKKKVKNKIDEEKQGCQSTYQQVLNYVQEICSKLENTEEDIKQ